MDKLKVRFSQFPRFSPGEDVFPSLGKRGLIVKIIVGAVVLAIVGVGTSLAVRIWDPLWNPFRPEPEEVLEKTFLNMKDVETVSLNMNINASKRNMEKREDFVFSFGGDSDFKNNEVKGKYDLFVSVEREDSSAEISVSIRDLEKDIYIKINELKFSSPMLMPFLGTAVDFFKDKWIKIEPAVSREMTGGINIKENIEKMEGLWSVKEELPDEELGGEKVYHYVLVLESERVKDLIEESIQNSGNGAALAVGFLGDIDKTLEAIEEVTADVLISKNKLQLHKLEMKKEIVAGQSQTGEKGEVNLDISVVFSNFNKPIDIKAPENFIDFNQMMRYFAPLLGFLGL